MSLVDEDTSVMDRLSELSLLNQSLESSLKELGGCQTEHIIEFALVVLQKTKSDHTSDKGLTFEESSWIVFIHGEKNTSSLSEFGEDKLSFPYFFLTSETVNTDQTKLVDKLFSLEGPSWLLGGLGVVGVFFWH